MGIEISKSKRFNVSADRLWTILGENFDRIGEWSRAVESSAVNEAAPVPEGADIGGRVCQTPGFGAIDETFTTFDPTERSYAFEATASKIPSFVRNITNHTKITPLGPDSASVDIKITADTHGVRGAMVKPMMTNQFSKTIDGLFEDLEEYAVTGEVSAAKRRALAKAA